VLVSPLPRSRLGAQSEQALHWRLASLACCVCRLPRGRPQRSRDRSHPRQPSRSLANSAARLRSLNRRVPQCRRRRRCRSCVELLAGLHRLGVTPRVTTDRLFDVSPKAPALGTPRSFFAVLVAACALTAALAVLFMSPQGGTSDTRSLEQARVSDALLFCT
jgi:hypothetical protein